MAIKQTNEKYWHENCEKLNKRYPDHFIAIYEGMPIIIEQDGDKFDKEVEEKYSGKDILQVFTPGLNAILHGNLKLTDLVIDRKGLHKIHEAMEKDRKYFLEHKEELLRDYNGEHVAIKDGVVVYHAKTWKEFVKGLDEKKLGRVYSEKVEEDSFREKSDLEISIDEVTLCQ